MTYNDCSQKLVQWFSSNGKKVVVALSGGVDSAVVACAAKIALNNNATAVTANYKTLSKEELSSAIALANEIGISHKMIEYDEVSNPKFAKNDELRCYHCRTELGSRLVREAAILNADLIVDGTHRDDISDIRPGIRALREYNVRSPLAELGISKTQVRTLARAFKLSIHDKPSNSCLASRIEKGSIVTYEKLKRIEKAEGIVKKLFCVRQVRVRDHGEIARVEVPSEDLPKLFDATKLGTMDTLLQNLGFRYITLDARGYRTGSMNPAS
jgi:pyridinium-3,5-biscarboxylic acid mononucleotide sulfurtransferase